MLEYLISPRMLLWIDAICIDQANLEGKAINDWTFLLRYERRPHKTGYTWL